MDLAPFLRYSASKKWRDL